MDDLYSSLGYNLRIVQEFLSIPNERFKLKMILYALSISIEDKITILEKLKAFLIPFSMFREIQEFMNSTYDYIQKTIEITGGSLNEFVRILIRTTLMGFIQEYVDYVRLYQKEEIFEYLTRALGKLSLQPLIINLGLLLKPMYQDKKYMERRKQSQEVEVEYTRDSEVETLIKGAIDEWIESQELNLDKQDDLRCQLAIEFNNLIEIYDVPKESELYKKLHIEVMEMLSLKLTVLSLMDSLHDDSYSLDSMT